MSKGTAEQLEVPGFSLFMKDCQADAKRLKGLQSGKVLPLFDGLDSVDASVGSAPSGETGEDSGARKFTGESGTGFDEPGTGDPAELSESLQDDDRVTPYCSGCGLTRHHATSELWFKGIAACRRVCCLPNGIDKLWLQAQHAARQEYRAYVQDSPGAVAGWQARFQGIQSKARALGYSVETVGAEVWLNLGDDLLEVIDL